MTRGNHGARLGVRPLHDVSLIPVNLSLEAYRRVDPFTVEKLVREFGPEAALRLLNGRPAHERPEVAPFDRSLLAPPGAIARPHGRRATGQAKLISEGS